MPDELQSTGLPESSLKAEGSVLTARAISTTWLAPLPPPHHLRAYSEIFPGCAERIVAMAETESQHRYSEDRAETEHRRIVIQAEVDSERRGMWLAFVLAMLIVGLSGFLLYTGHLGWGVGLVSAELITLAGLFIYGRSGRSSERSDLAKLSDAQQELPFPSTDQA